MPPVRRPTRSPSCCWRRRRGAASGPTSKLFATDLDAKALATAREGCYPAAIAADVSEDRLTRYFVRDGDRFRIRREVRDLVVFALHSVLRDPPFSRVNLVTCRNLMIYLDRDVQQQVCEVLHYALLPQGYLFLGASETADSRAGSVHRRGSGCAHLPGGRAAA